MDDDLDTPGALAGVFDLVRRANAAADAGDADRRPQRAAGTAALLGAALGSGLRAGAGGRGGRRPRPTWSRRRDEARAARDWDEADALRAELEAAGWLVEDGPEGPGSVVGERRVNRLVRIGPSTG